MPSVAEVPEHLTYTRPISRMATRERTPSDHGLQIVQNSISSSFGHSYRRTAAAIPINSNQETQLLSHFRYKLAPWIDVGDPAGFSGIEVMLLTRISRPLFAAVIALAACHKSLTTPQLDEDYRECCHLYREEAEHGILDAEDPIARSIRVLLTLGDFISSSPLHWRNSLTHQEDIPSNISINMESEHVENSHQFWILFSLGICSILKLVSIIL